MKYIIALLILIQTRSFAQYQVNISFNNPKDSIIYFRLSSFDDNIFIPKDTAKLINNKARFSSKTSVFGGFYSIFLPKSGKKIQLCLENKDIISLNINGDKLDSLQTSDPKNRLFLQYQILERSFSGLDSLYADLQKKGNVTLKSREALYKPKRDSLLAFRQKALKSIKTGSLLHKYFTWLNTLDEFSPNRQAYAAREQFLTSFPIQDPQLYFSPILKDVLYEYLSSYPLQADSLLAGMDAVMNRLDCKDKAYPNTFNYFSTVLQSSTVKNNLVGYTQYIEKYLINNKCTFLKNKKDNEYMSKYMQFKQLAKTDTVINITLKDSSGVSQTLTDRIQKNDFTIICFYDPTCEHCKVLVPELDLAVKSVINQTNFAVEVYAICNANSFMEKEWKKFIVDNQLTENFTHVIMGDNDKPRIDYAAYGNPMFFLTDKSGTIILKKATISSIKNYILRKRKK